MPYSLALVQFENPAFALFSSYPATPGIGRGHLLIVRQFQLKASLPHSQIRSEDIMELLLEREVNPESQAGSNTPPLHSCPLGCGGS